MTYWNTLLLNAPNIPKENGTIGPARAEQALVYWMPRDRTSFLLVSTEYLHLLAKITYIEELQ